MKEHPAFQGIVREGHVYQMNCSLGRFGATSEKPLQVYSNVDWLQEVVLHEDAFPNPEFEQGSPLVVYHVQDDEVKVTGLRRQLKDSQAYPAGFGRACAFVYEDNIEKFLEELYASRANVRMKCPSIRRLLTGEFADWDKHADFEAVVAFAEGRVAEDPYVILRATCKCPNCTKEDEAWKHRLCVA